MSRESLNLGYIRIAQNDLGSAESHLREALDEFGTDRPGDTFLIGAQLVRLLILQGRAAEACNVARSLTSLVIPLKSEPVLASTHTDLVRAGLEGERALTLGLVDRVIAEIERERDPASPAHLNLSRLPRPARPHRRS